MTMLGDYHRQREAGAGSNACNALIVLLMLCVLIAAFAQATKQRQPLRHFLA